jgi:hypothetical protein
LIEEVRKECYCHSKQRTSNYLVRMSIQEAKDMIEEDDYYDDNGMLKGDIQEDYVDKHGDDFEEEKEVKSED